VFHSRSPCRHFIVGKCEYGVYCRFSHVDQHGNPLPVAKPSISNLPIDVSVPSINLPRSQMNVPEVATKPMKLELQPKRVSKLLLSASDEERVVEVPLSPDFFEGPTAPPPAAKGPVSPRNLQLSPRTVSPRGLAPLLVDGGLPVPPITLPPSSPRLPQSPRVHSLSNLKPMDKGELCNLSLSSAKVPTTLPSPRGSRKSKFSHIFAIDSDQVQAM